MVIDWGDGTTNTVSTNYPSHTYSNSGSYIINITSGSFTNLNASSVNSLYKSSLTSFAYNTQIPALTNFNNAFTLLDI